MQSLRHPQHGAARACHSKARCSVPRRSPALRCRAAAEATAAEAAAPVVDKAQRVKELVEVLKKGAIKKGVSPAELLTTVLALEKLKFEPAPQAWGDIVQGPWQLTWTAGVDEVQKAMKKQPGGGGGLYVPITAAQQFTPADGQFENGVFLGPLAHLTFKGPFLWTGRKLVFDVDTLFVGVGPWRGRFQLKQPEPLTNQDGTPREKLAGMPCFTYVYADSEVMAARGRSGGLAVWVKPTAEKAAKGGFLQVYKSM